jgi:hypothetical protein
MRLPLSRHDRAFPYDGRAMDLETDCWIGDRRIRSERCITLHMVRSLGVEPLIATTMPHARGFDPGCKIACNNDPSRAVFASNNDPL